MIIVAEFKFLKLMKKLTMNFPIYKLLCRKFLDLIFKFDLVEKLLFLVKSQF